MADQRSPPGVQPEVRETETNSHSPAIRSESSSDDVSPELAHERPSNTNIPVTPGISLATYEIPSPASSNKPHSPSYFLRDPAQQDRLPKQESSSERPSFMKKLLGGADIFKNEMADQEVLRRMSLSLRGPRESISDIKQVGPDLGLTGNVISATFVTPYRITHRQNGEWELGYRHGQSALVDSFSYLSSDKSPWNHTVVAWTGEIEASSEPLSPPHTPPETTANIPAASSLSAPVPVSGKASTNPPAADGIWIPKRDMVHLEEKLVKDERIATVPVWLADKDDKSEEGIRLKDQKRWRNYAEHQLYTLMHYKQNEPTNGKSERREWADFYTVNTKFADKIVEIYKPGDIVVVHDYSLMLLPSLLRQRIPKVYIAFFLHCPFPSSEFLRCLPQRKEILEGVLGSNLVGFQSHSYLLHFKTSCSRILELPSDENGIYADGRRIDVGTFPIGINSAKVGQLAWLPEVTQKYEALKKLYRGKKIIVGRDRLDSVRGVTQKLMAFERFLELYPEWRDKVVLVQVTSPTSISDEKDDPTNKVASRVNELVSKINGLHGSLESVPVQHYPQYLSPDEYFALLRAADIGLITSVRDGMNTTSLEYVVCQRDNAGPLILSEFSGTAGSLKHAIHINPWDLTDVAHQIHHALAMPADQRISRQKLLYDHVTNHNFQSWITKFLRKLVGSLASTENIYVTPLLDRSLLLSQYRSAKKRLFMFDYDGTLTPIVQTPDAAIPSERIISTLKNLASDERNAVWIISGRDREFLHQYLGHIPNLGFSAEHGSFIRYPGKSEWATSATEIPWKEDVIAIFRKITEDQLKGSSIEPKTYTVTWHYRNAIDQSRVKAEWESAKRVLDDWKKGKIVKGKALALDLTGKPVDAHGRVVGDDRKVTDEETGNRVDFAPTYVDVDVGDGEPKDVEVMDGKANLEVRSTDTNKGFVAKKLAHEYAQAEPIEFILCLGDDRTDEDMFRGLNALDDRVIRKKHVFTVMVGSDSDAERVPTVARWNLPAPEDVLDTAALLADDSLSGPGEKL